MCVVIGVSGAALVFSSRRITGNMHFQFSKENSNDSSVFVCECLHPYMCVWVCMCVYACMCLCVCECGGAYVRRCLSIVCICVYVRVCMCVVSVCVSP